MRGGEKVLEEILDFFPGADIYTLFLEENNISQRIRSHKIFASSLNKYSFIRNRYKHFLPFFPSTIEDFNLNNYDVIISSSHCVAKGIIPPPGAVHISYIHSPMRYIWDQYHSYFGKTKGLMHSFIKNRVSKLRMWDVTSSARVDHFIANSTFVQERIRKYYRRDSIVIPPPVDTEFYHPSTGSKRSHFLTVCALVPYKENELLIEAFNRSGDPLIIVGKGPEENKLKKKASSNISFKKNLSAEELRELYRNSIAFVFAGIEDFGISFVESQACGTPVVAFNKGGVKDIVTPGTGILFDTQTPDCIIDAIDKIKNLSPAPSLIRENSLKFSLENFKKMFKNYIDQVL